MIKKLLITLTILLLFSACHHEIDISLPEVKNKRVLFVGEYHDNYAHHINQMKIIQKLHEDGAKVAIGMEMFQRRFQPVIDDYLAGKVDEKVFLQKSEYYKRWGYDYKLYKPIMIYAKENHIPVIALNLEKEITKKISRAGLDSLNLEEKKMIPKDLDFSVESYKKRLLDVFNDPEHLAAMPKKYRPNPEYLYQSQILWDETMADTTAKYLKSHPETIMIVLAGNGHLEHFIGIPNRVKRRIDIPMSILLQDCEKEDGKADQYLFPKSIMIEPTPKLGIHLELQGLKVTSVIKNSLAEKLGIEEKDSIIEVDGIPTKELADLKLALYLYHERIGLPLESKELSIRVKRGDKEIVLR